MSPLDKLQASLIVKGEIRMKRALQQGQSDGLCGIYSLLNFLIRTRGFGWQDSSDSLWYLLDASRQLGCFNPYTLTQGFEEHQLKAIIDLQFENYRMPYKTFSIGELSKQVGIKNFYDLANKVTVKNGSLIASWDRRNHWVLVTAEAGDMVVIDSAAGGKALSLNRRQKSLTLAGGLIILPKERPPLEVSL